MNQTKTYSNHIRHYQLDGEYYDFFKPDKFMDQETRRRYQEFFSLHNVRSGDLILEVGSGGGFALEPLSHIKPKYFPLDIPVNNLKEIKSQATFPVFPAAADVYQLPFKNSMFHLVILAEVLEHLAKPKEALLEINRVLQKNNTLIISVPYKELISYQICIHCNKPTPTHAHLHSFDVDSLSDLITSSGFKLIRIAKNCNKIPNRLHLNLFLKKIPFSLWKIMDHSFNLFADKPTSLIAVCQKM